MYSILRKILILTFLLLGYMAALAAYLLPYGWTVGIAILAAMMCRKTYRYTSGGSARWAARADIPHMLEGPGLGVGQIDSRVTKAEGIKALFSAHLSARMACEMCLMAFQRKQPPQLVRLTKAVHTAIIAPTGVGKGVSFVIPFLKTCPESCVVVDFKGENARICAHDQKRKGHRVVIVDPFRVVTEMPDAFNPLQFIDPESPTALDECRDLAEALVIKTGQEKEPHWNDSAEIWIASMIAFVVCFASGEEKNLQSVRTLLANPQSLQRAIQIMCESDKWDGMLSRLGHQLQHFIDKELHSTMTTVNRHMRFLDTLAVAESTKSSSFDPADLRKGKMTVYLILPPEHMRAQSALLRLWIGSLFRACVRGGLSEKNKVHFVLDEAASLGHMEALDDAVDKYRGYGVRLQLYLQSMAQLKKMFPDGQDQTLLSNVTQVFFGVNDYSTASYVSAMLGKETIIVEEWGENKGWSSQSGGGEKATSTTYSGGKSMSRKQQPRELAQPDEVMRWDERIAITFCPGTPPIATWLPRYYEGPVATGLGPVKMAVDAACLFLLAAAGAAWVTAALYFGTFQ